MTATDTPTASARFNSLLEVARRLAAEQPDRLELDTDSRLNEPVAGMLHSEQASFALRRKSQGWWDRSEMVQVIATRSWFVGQPRGRWTHTVYEYGGGTTGRRDVQVRDAVHALRWLAR